jgi:hypothetical protein
MGAPPRRIAAGEAGKVSVMKKVLSPQERSVLANWLKHYDRFLYGENLKPSKVAKMFMRETGI